VEKENRRSLGYARDDKVEGRRLLLGAVRSDGEKRNSRSLHFATPDFLWNLVALTHFMRLSLRKGAHAALSSSEWQEIRVRFGRDDNFV
jgi:hypothetical protein